MMIRNALTIPTLVSFGALVVLGACGAPESGNETQSDVKIVGGSEVPETQNDPRRYSTVALTSDVQGSDKSKPALIDRGVSFCTGTIIGSRTILTAAHCLVNFDQKSGAKNGLLFPKEENFLIYFGTRVKKEGKLVKAAKVIPHPDWDPKSTISPFPGGAPNDIGVIVLSEDIPQGYQPVEIADPADKFDGQMAYLAGFGVPFSRSFGNTGTLRQVDVRLTGVDARTKRFSVGAFFRGACAGDSGGPAFVRQGDKWKVIGATSTGAEVLTACIGVINNYTDARQYKDWIASVTR